jgi:transposase
MTGSQTIAWQLLAHNCNYHDLGGDHFVRHADSEPRKRHLIRQLEALGYKVTVEPAAA